MPRFPCAGRMPRLECGSGLSCACHFLTVTAVRRTGLAFRFVWDAWSEYSRLLNRSFRGRTRSRDILYLSVRHAAVPKGGPRRDRAAGRRRAGPDLSRSLDSPPRSTEGSHGQFLRDTDRDLRHRQVGKPDGERRLDVLLHRGWLSLSDAVKVA